MVPFYQTLIKDTEHEVRSNALTQFGTLARVCYERFDSKEITLPLLQAIKELLTVNSTSTQDQSHHVRNSLVSVLSNSVQYISETFIKDDLLNILFTMLKDEIIDVKLTAINHFHKFFRYLDPAVISERIVGEYKTLVKDKNWKIRFAVLQSVPHLLDLGSSELMADFTYINDQLRDDHIFCIRDRIIQNFVDSYRREHAEKLDQEITSLVNYWSSCNNYIYRVSCVHLMVKFSNLLNADVYKKLLSLVVDRFKNDKVGLS